jgi:hypothetical protein
VRELARHFPVVLLTGGRQTGKTSLLRRLFPDATVVALDLPSAAAEAEQTPDRFLQGLREPILLDEAQYAPALFRYLKIRVDADRHRMGRFLMTGSRPPA